MRIKQLELLGFKSFKNKTVLTFPSGITAIVGPNGCGKSNVVDALRWVMGEQSPRHLRGQEMGDVVFGGNHGNAPMGMAEVTLMLERDNSEPLGDGAKEPVWNEVMISRRYFRSGDSEYLFNKVPCRLRDIVEFFLGTGTGTKAYSLIEQGRVDHLINAKPDEVRALIEEAAGVSLYRSRRLAAERKMERTRENLARVADLLREMERQLASLRRQTKKAEQYRALQEEFKLVDLTLLCGTYRRLSADIVSIETQREALHAQEEHLGQEEQQMIAERAQVAAALGQEEAALRTIEDRFHSVESVLRQGEQKKQFLLQHEQQTVARTSVAEREAVELTDKDAQIEQELHLISVRTGELERLLRQDEERICTSELETGTLQRALQTCEVAAEQIKSEIVELLTHEAQVQNASAYARRRSNEVTQRLQVLALEAERISSLREDNTQALLSVQSRTSQLRERLLAGQHQRVEKTDGLREVVSLGEQLEGNLTAAWAKQAELRARLTTLQEMEERYERYPQGVQSIMATAESPADICGVVAQVVEVPEEYERAVAAVLRDKLEYVMVSAVEDGLKAVDYLRTTQSGRGSFIPLSPKRSQASHNGHNGYGYADGHGVIVGEGTAPLLTLLTVDQRYRDIAEVLLGNTFLVPDLQAGLQLWHQNGTDHTFVTPTGEVIGPHGVISGGSEGFAEEALLERRREIRGLKDTVAQQELVVADFMHRRQETKRKQQELEGEILRLEAEARALGRESEALQREEGKLEGELRRLLDKSESVGYERHTLGSEQQALTQEISSKETQDAELKGKRQEREAALAVVQAEVAQAKVQMEQHRVAADEVRVRVAERRERLEGMRNQLQRLGEQRQDLIQRMEACRQEIASAQAAVEHVQAQLVELDERLGCASAEQAEIIQEQTLRQQMCTQLRDRYTRCDEQLERVRTRSSSLQEEQHRLEVDLAGKKVSGEHLAAMVRERYELTIEDILAQYGDPALEGPVGEERRQELRDKITRLGEVNPGAAAELATEEERYGFLQSQEADLRRSLDDLQNSIAKLNRESRERFRDTFTQVDTTFRAVYSRLVDGGKAQLTLTDEDNMAESGVEIAVQPPGKRLRVLQLLSGGEKALAALSFTFALFLIRPSPFCVLDEVDAPLDDANVGRFNQLIKQLSENTQVILITHNKRTMEAATTLYGVTMQEPGVSTIVSVRVS